MGAWSVKPFGNDSALDWLSGLDSLEAGKIHISNSVEQILDNYEGCSTKAVEALAAISIITASISEPVKGTNKDAKAWIVQTGYTPCLELIDKSINAIDVIASESELKDLWGETNSLKTWIKDIESLRSKLVASKDRAIPIRKPKKKRMPRNLSKLIEYYRLNPEEKIREKILNKFQKLDRLNEGSNETDFYLPLSLAAKHGLLNETTILIKKGADPNAESIFGGSPFSQACVNGYTDIADVLIEAGANIFRETVMDENTGYSYNPELYEDTKETPKLKTLKYCLALFSVASLGKPEVIDYLISKGSNVNQIDLNGETLLHKAIEADNIATLEHLVELGVDLNVSKGIINGNKDSRGATALHCAVGKGNLQAVNLLLINGVNPNITEYFFGRENTWNKTPLDIAKNLEAAEIYQVLLKYGGKHAADLIA